MTYLVEMILLQTKIFLAFTSLRIYFLLLPQGFFPPTVILNKHFQFHNRFP